MPPDVIENDATETPVVPAGQSGKTKDESVTLSKAEFESLRRERDEARESERYWAERARGGKADPEPQEEEFDGSKYVDRKAPAGVENDTAEKLIEDFSTRGAAAFKDRGFITMADAQKLSAETASKVARELIGQERQKITSDTTLMSEFPDLKDQNSELFKETARRYQKAVAMDPNAKKTPATLYLAADSARESLRHTRRDDNSEDESDRRRRADSQDSRARGRGDVDERDDMLGDEARQVIKSMGITEEEFNASRKATVRPGRR